MMMMMMMMMHHDDLHCDCMEMSPSAAGQPAMTCMVQNQCETTHSLDPPLYLYHVQGTGSGEGNPHTISSITRVTYQF